MSTPNLTTVETKICSKCYAEKPKSDFNKEARASDGLRSECKMCQSKRAAKYRKSIRTLPPLPQKKCPKCQMIKSKEEFRVDYASPTKLRPYCKKCEPRYTSKRKRNLKKFFVDLAGGQCQKCGYKEFMCSLDFHHVDATSKVYGPAMIIEKRELAHKELDKCVLLCKNCHSSLEHGYWQADFVKRDGLGFTIKNERLTELSAKKPR